MRLIDADALVSALNNGRLKDQTGRAVPFNAGVAFALTMVEYAPTIDAVPRWIPCEERLPENSNTVLITKKSVFGNDNVVCFGWYTGDNHWAIINYKEPNVIAWMPLPDPYVGERKDDDKTYRR